MSAKYYNSFATLYLKGKVTKDGLKRAVQDGKLTKDEYESITQEIYDED